MVEEVVEVSWVFHFNANGKKIEIPYFIVGDNGEGRYDHKVWVAHALVKWRQGNHVVVFVSHNSQLVRDGDKVNMRESPGHCVHSIFIPGAPPGDQKVGGSRIELREPIEPHNITYRHVKATRDGKIISVGMLVNAPSNQKVTFTWKKYGNVGTRPAFGTRVLLPNGEIRDQP